MMLGSLSNKNGNDNENATKQRFNEQKQSHFKSIYILVHLFAVLCKATTLNDERLRFLTNVRAWRHILLSFLYFNAVIVVVA